MLAEVIFWKFPGTPGIAIEDNIIIRWPSGTARPTQANIDAWTAEYALLKGERDARRQKFNTFLKKVEAVPDRDAFYMSMFEALIDAQYGNSTKLDRIKGFLDSTQ